MLSSNIPSKVPLPFADTGTKNVIPTASQIGITPGAASLTDGFPPLTMTPIAAGGIPPAGADFNGILNLITAFQQWQSAGGSFKYDSTFSTAIGGYPAGAVIMSADDSTLWLNLADNNTTDPDGGSPADWSPLAAYGIGAVTGLTNANVTLTPAQYSKRIITLAGTLTGNVQLIFPTNQPRCLIINNTSGNFSVTCKTAAGTGVAVPQLGMQEVYGDGTNLAPLLGDNRQFVPAGYKNGLTLSNNVSNPNTQVDFSSGVCSSSDNLRTLELSAVTTKTLQSSGAFAAGTGNNGLFTGAKANSTWYHCFIIRKALDGSIDCGFDTSTTAANIPAGYGAYRWVGAVKTDGSGNIIAFRQVGDEVLWVTPLADVTATGIGNGTSNQTVNVPPGVVVEAILQGAALSSIAAGLYHINSPGINDVAGNLYPTAASPAVGAMGVFGRVRVKTNTSQQVQFNTDTDSTSLWLSAYGWINP